MLLDSSYYFFLKFTYSENTEVGWAMFPILWSFEGKMMYSIKSMHHNADSWDVTSGIVGILAKLIKFIFSVFPLSYIFVMTLIADA